MEYGIHTKNRYELLQERELENHSYNRDQFISCSTDQKLNRIFDEMCCMKGEQIKCNHGFERIEQSLGGMSRTMGQVVQAVNSSTDFFKTLAYESIDMEARARRNNIIIRGIAENRGKNCFQLLRDFVSNHLDLDPAHMYITWAHRLGRINPNKGHQSRPIIVNFRDFCDIEMIMSNARMLRGKPFSIDHGYPRIQEARSRLWPMYKEGKRDSPDARLTIAYPAKLIKNGRVIKDELPEWDILVQTDAHKLNIFTLIVIFDIRRMTDIPPSSRSQTGAPLRKTFLTSEQRHPC